MGKKSSKSTKNVENMLNTRNIEWGFIQQSMKEVKFLKYQLNQLKIAQKSKFPN